MSSDIEQSLRGTADSMTMDRPLAEVLERGDRLRRRRAATRVLAGAATGALVVAGVGVGLTTLVDRAAGDTSIGPADSPGAQAPSNWSGGRTDLSDNELSEVRAECLTGEARLLTRTPEESDPIAVEQRGDNVAAQYVHDGTSTTCILKRSDDGGLRLVGVSDSADEAPPGGDAAIVESGGGNQGPLIWVTGRVSDEVSRVTITVAGETFDGGVVEGRALFWLPDGTPWNDVFGSRTSGGSVLTAYDDLGDVLGEDRVVDE